MKERKKQEWIEQGYSLVAEQGFDNLGVNSICRMVNKNKSSFYHFFGDLELFKAELLAYHLKRGSCFATEVSEAENIDPSLIHLFIDYKIDFFFSKQLRIKNNDSTLKECSERVWALYEAAVMEKWVIYFELNGKRMFAKKFLRFISEHFFLSISPQNYTFKWLKCYLKDISDMIRQLKNDT